MKVTTGVQLQWVTTLLVMGLTLNGCAYFGMAGIQRAARKGDIELAESSLLKGADINLRDRHGNTPLHFAATRDLRGFIPAATPGADIKALLKLAGTLEDVMVMNLLLDNGADINATNTAGRTPLHAAAEHNSPQMALFLLSRGADASIKDKIGQTPMDLAMQHGYKDLLETLQKKADVLMPVAPVSIAPETQDSPQPIQ